MSKKKPFLIEIAKGGQAACKKCLERCLQGQLRIAKLNPIFSRSGKMKAWFHIKCIFEMFLKQRPTTKRIETTDDIDGWDALTESDKEMLLNEIHECNKTFYNKSIQKSASKLNKSVTSPSPTVSTNIHSSNEDSMSVTSDISIKSDLDVHPDNTFRRFRKFISDLLKNNDKISVISNIFVSGSDGSGFKGDVIIWCKLILPSQFRKHFEIEDNTLLKIFSKLFRVSYERMLKDQVKRGDVGETIEFFYEHNDIHKPQKSSCLTVQEVDNFLDHLIVLHKEDAIKMHFESIINKCTARELKIILYLINNDLQINVTIKDVLKAIHKDAFDFYLKCKDFPAAINKFKSKPLNLFTPTYPVISETCKSVDEAFKLYPNGIIAENYYEGEKVQVHKSGSKIKYFMRNLKPAPSHLAAFFKDWIKKAFSNSRDLIIDTEITVFDKSSGKSLHFDALETGKSSENKDKDKDISACMIVYDCIYRNGENLMQNHLKLRKKLLKEIITEIPNHIVLSKMDEVHKPEDLSLIYSEMFRSNSSGLILKNIKSVYEPGRRNYLKIKKKYLLEESIKEPLELTVLGAWYSNKDEMMSVFLMGCYDEDKNQFCTVTKVHAGFDNQTLKNLQAKLDMIKISCDPEKVPNWLRCNRSLIPDFIARNPQQQPVWEISGCKLVSHNFHTADSISIELPYIVRVRNDRTWKTATTLTKLKSLFNNTKINSTTVNQSNLDNSSHNLHKSKEKRKFLADEENADNVHKKKKMYKKIKDHPEFKSETTKKDSIEGHKSKKYPLLISTDDVNSDNQLIPKNDSLPKPDAFDLVVNSTYVPTNRKELGYSLGGKKKMHCNSTLPENPKVKVEPIEIIYDIQTNEDKSLLSPKKSIKVISDLLIEKKLTELRDKEIPQKGEDSKNFDPDPSNHISKITTKKNDQHDHSLINQIDSFLTSGLVTAPEQNKSTIEDINDNQNQNVENPDPLTMDDQPFFQLRKDRKPGEGISLPILLNDFYDDYNNPQTKNKRPLFDRSPIKIKNPPSKKMRYNSPCYTNDKGERTEASSALKQSSINSELSESKVELKNDSHDPLNKDLSNSDLGEEYSDSSSRVSGNNEKIVNPDKENSPLFMHLTNLSESREDLVKNALKDTEPLSSNEDEPLLDGDNVINPHPIDEMEDTDNADKEENPLFMNLTNLGESTENLVKNALKDTALSSNEDESLLPEDNVMSPPQIDEIEDKESSEIVSSLNLEEPTVMIDEVSDATDLVGSDEDPELYFKDVKLLLDEGSEKFVDILELFGIHGGTILKSFEYKEATHVLHTKDTISHSDVMCPKSARHVIVEWLGFSLMQKTLLDCLPYTVRLESPGVLTGWF